MKTTKIIFLLMMAMFAISSNAETNGATLQFHQQGDVSYVSGGVGKKESEAIRNASKDYLLEMVFMQKASPREQMLAGVQVVIKDQKGNVVLDTVTDGPYLLVNLPKERYTVLAGKNGNSITKKVSISKENHRKLFFLWEKPID